MQPSIPDELRIGPPVPSDAGEVITVQRAAYVTEAPLPAGLPHILTVS